MFYPPPAPPHPRPCQLTQVINYHNVLALHLVRKSAFLLQFEKESTTVPHSHHTLHTIRGLPSAARPAWLEAKPWSSLTAQLQLQMAIGKLDVAGGSVAVTLSL